MFLQNRKKKGGHGSSMPNHLSLCHLRHRDFLSKRRKEDGAKGRAADYHML